MSAHPRVTVLYGGWSAERAVSLVSGQACCEGLIEAGYDARLLDARCPLPELISALENHAPSVLFNALHGQYGEDGRIQSVLDLLNIPYTHSGAAASALAMDKVASKAVLSSVGMPVARHITGTRAQFIAAQGDPLPRPYVLKPLSEGSSVGVHLMFDGKNLGGQNSDAAQLLEGERAEHWMAEAYIDGRELTVAVLDDRGALAVTEIRPKTGFYNYEAKYTDGITDHIVPAELDPATEAEVKRLAELAHAHLGCRATSRSDFRLSSSGDLVYLETNTQPGMTPLSLLPEQAQHVGISFPDLVSWLVEQATCDG